MSSLPYTTLFLDIGGVLLTNGWDRHARARAAQVFNLDYAEMNMRHALIFDTYEIGKLTLNEYIERVVFYEPRFFSVEQFKEFMFAQSMAFEPMLDFMKGIKRDYGLKVVALSNEGKELMLHRIEKFHLKQLFDSFVCSCFVRLRKPDKEIYQLALDLSQASPEEVIYIDDRPMLVEIGQKFGMQAVQQIDFEKTKLIVEDLLKMTMKRG